MKIFLLALILSFTIISCSDDDKPTSPGKPKVTTISPDRGSIGTPVIISGENFPTNKADIAVRFNGTAAVVDSAVATKIYVRVPMGATTGKVSITISAVVFETTTDFTVISTTTSLMPFDIGNYWVYSKHQLDTNNVVISANPGRDSLFASGNILKLSKTANYMTTFSKVDLSSQYVSGADQFFYEEGGITFTHSSWFDDLMNFGASGLPLPFEMTEQWLKLIDPANNEWLMYSKAFENTPFSFGTLTGNLTLTGINLGTSNVTVSGHLYNDTRMINYKFVFTGTATTQLGVIPLNLERVLSVWYAPSVGRIKTKMNSMRFYIPNLANQIIPGYELNLINSKVK